jgi:hypothetical protein
MPRKKMPSVESTQPVQAKKARTVKAPQRVGGGSEPEIVAEADGPTCEEIALRAYALWEDRGRPFGSPEEDWFRAQQELSQR